MRDYWGDVVSSGSFSGDTCVPAAPSGGWKPGWYRIYFTGPLTDAVYGNAYGETTVTIVRADSRFPANTGTGPGPDDVEVGIRGVLGMPPPRFVVLSGRDYAADLADAVTNARAIKVGDIDPARPAAKPWVAFTSNSVDFVRLPNMVIRPATSSVDGDDVWVQFDPGTSTGWKITVRVPDAATVVETFDNLASPVAAETATASSAYIRAFKQGSTWGTPAAEPAQRLTRQSWRGVQDVVTTMMAEGVTHFEGPTNEPDLNAHTAHMMGIFHDCVKDADPAAVVMGPATVSVDDAAWESFAAAIAGKVDVISTHWYNALSGGNLAVGRRVIPAFKQWLTDAGIGSIELWDTESNTVFTEQGNVFHWRNPAVSLLWVHFAEQYGIPRERNPYWYDRAHGFNTFPAFMVNGCLFPHGILYRTLAEETFGKPFQQALEFGTLAEFMFLGSVFRTSDAAAGVAVLQSASDMPGATVTLAVTGMTSGSLTLVDCLSRESTATVTGGKVTVPVRIEPTYLRLPGGVTVDVDHVLDWTEQALPGFGVQSRQAATCTLGGVSAPGLNNGAISSKFAGRVDYWTATTTVPTAAVLDFSTAYRFDHVIVWFGPPVSWAEPSVGLTFTVDGSNDGSSWTTLATVDVSDEATTTPWVSSATQETWWMPQWIHDVRLPSVAEFRYLRVNVTAVSYGAEPNVTAGTTTIAPNPPKVTFMEITALCDSDL